MSFFRFRTVISCHSPPCPLCELMGEEMRHMEHKKNKELKIIFLVVTIYFLIFLAVPILMLLFKSLQADEQTGLANYQEVLGKRGFFQALQNSFVISAVSAAASTLLGFFLAYTIHYTGLPRIHKTFVYRLAQLPMYLPTITYGFAIIYSFGKQGLITRILGRQPFELYGFAGLLTGYVIYTLPVAFLLIQNTMHYIDKSFMVVSRIMGDNPVRTFCTTLLRPLLSTLVSAFIQTFFLCFTDFGIPASVGGRYETIAGVLYKEMLGSVPDFGKGAVVAFVMLLPSVLSILGLHALEKYNVRYSKVSNLEVRKSRLRDGICGTFSTLILISVLSVFAVIFILPFIHEWPYRITFTLDHIKSVFRDNALSQVVINSLKVSLITAFFGTLTAYGSALITARSNLGHPIKRMIEGIAMVTNTIPGMVLGLSYLFVFSGTFLQGTLAILVGCTIVHYFSTPYLMMKSCLSKMNASWETTALLMGDKWLHTILRVVTPNAFGTIVEVFGYYFINAMVTISAVIFIAGARTMVITAKIKELQYYNKFNEVFVLSMLILIINLSGRVVFTRLGRLGIRKEKNNERYKESIGAAAGSSDGVCRS